MKNTKRQKDGEAFLRTMWQDALDIVFESYAIENRALTNSQVIQAAYAKLEEEGYEGEFYYAWIHDIYDSEEGRYIILSSKGRFYRMTYTIGTNDMITFADPELVMVQHVPIEDSRMRIVRQADGSYRWVAISATAILNRVGVVDSTALYDDFVANLDEYPAPILTYFHTPTIQLSRDKRIEFNFGTVDTVLREDYVLILAGSFNDDEITQRVIAAMVEETDDSYWGVSIGFIATEQPNVEVMQGVEVPVYNHGYLLELSLLPEKVAANYHTSISASSTSSEERKLMVSQTFIEGLRRAGLGDIADDLADDVDEINREIVTDDNIIKRSTDDDPTPEPESDDDQIIMIPQAVLDNIIETTAAQVTQSLEPLIRTLSEQVTTLQKQLRSVEAEREIEALADSPYVILKRKGSVTAGDETPKRPSTTQRETPDELKGLATPPEAPDETTRNDRNPFVGFDGILAPPKAKEA